MSPEIFLMILLQLKHFYFDFVNQKQNEINHKSIYGSWLGIKHSVKHSIGTGLAIWIVMGYNGIPFVVSMAILDLFAHYHIDYVKMRYGCKDTSNSKFWRDMGLDQFAHQLTYILILGLIIL